MRCRRRWRALTLAGVVAQAGLACTSRDDDVPTKPCSRRNPEGKVPCGDFGNALGTTDELFVLGRVIEEDADFELASTTPSHDLEQAEVPSVEIELRLFDAERRRVFEQAADTDEEGWLGLTLDLSDAGLRPGKYTVEVWGGRYFLAASSARLIDTEYDEHVVVSDVDLTYLDTDFHSASAILELLDQSATERVPLPGMPQTYRELRVGADGESDVPLVFLSGSPLFFHRVLAERARLDRIEQDGLLLKPLKLLLMHELLAGIDGGDLFSSLLGDVDAVLGAAGDQIGFKLAQLFAQQLRLPASTRLVLLGDDSETDPVVYALFHRTLAGELHAEALLDELEDLDVDDYWLDAIERLAPRVLERREPAASPVDGIFINQTPVPNEDLPVADWVIAGLTVLHAGSEPLRAALAERGFLPN